MKFTIQLLLLNLEKLISDEGGQWFFKKNRECLSQFLMQKNGKIASVRILFSELSRKSCNSKVYYTFNIVLTYSMVKLYPSKMPLFFKIRQSELQRSIIVPTQVDHDMEG